jgi:hypothetical protein
MLTIDSTDADATATAAVLAVNAVDAVDAVAVAAVAADRSQPESLLRACDHTRSHTCTTTH